MRRTTLLGLTILLGGCQFAGNPFDGFGGFMYDTQTFHSNPNLPGGSDETMRRAEGDAVDVPPLQSEPGDVWPGPVKPIPTMQDLQQRNDMQNQLPPPNVPTATPPALFPNEPGGTPGVVVPNGNGTSTAIGPDGSIRTVPTPP